MTNFRLSYNNLAAAEGASLSAASNLDDFPASNAAHEYRSKRYKPKGAFRISSTNNKIYINDGSDKTVTLTSAVYAGGAALASHAQTQLNASSSNWTVTYSTSTGIFTFARSSGTKVLRLSVTTEAAWDTFGFTGTVNQDASAADVRRNHTSERLAVDLGSSREVSFLAVYGSPDTQFTIPDTAVCVLKASASNDYDTATTIVSPTPTASGIYSFFAAADYRYWWFDFIDRENPDGPESYSLKLWLGDYVSPVNRNIVNGFSIRHVDPSIIRRSANGVRYAYRRTKYWLFQNLAIAWISGSDREILRDAFSYCGTTRPLFVSIDPAAVISSGVEEFTKLMNFNEDFETEHQRFDQYGVAVSFSEVVG